MRNRGLVFQLFAPFYSRALLNPYCNVLAPLIVHLTMFISRILIFYGFDVSRQLNRSRHFELQSRVRRGEFGLKQRQICNILQQTNIVGCKSGLKETNNNENATSWLCAILYVVHFMRAPKTIFCHFV